MTNLYRPVSDRARAMYGDEDVERTFTPADEADMVSAGHLEIVPRPYRVLVNNYAGGGQGDVVDLALPVENEAALLSGAILERADPVKKTPAKKSAK
jgi:hypothetical protein